MACVWAREVLLSGGPKSFRCISLEKFREKQLHKQEGSKGEVAEVSYQELCEEWAAAKAESVAGMKTGVDVEGA